MNKNINNDSLIKILQEIDKIKEIIKVIETKILNKIGN